MTAPIATTRVDANRLMLRPDGFKFGADPGPIEVTFDWSNGLCLRGRRVTEDEAVPDLEAEVVQFVTKTPGVTSGQVASGLGRQRQAVLDVLKRLERGGRLQKVKDGSAHRWRVVTT